MAVEYDLVVIGSSWVGLYAAQQAVKLQARVALVTGSEALFLPNDTLTSNTLGEVGWWNYQLENNSLHRVSETISLAAAQDWTTRVNSTIQSKNSLADLAALGVDVIIGQGKFSPLPKLFLQTAQRQLHSRKFLLATGANFVPEFADQDHSHGYITLRELWQMDLADLKQNIIIVGGDPAALELAQTLGRFQKQVTLVTSQPRILPQEDLEFALLLQAQLEAEGIKIYADSPVSQIKIIDGQKWLQAGDRALTAEEIIIADCRQPNIMGLNLEEVNVKYDRSRVYVNQKLQTTNADIYACGDLIGGYSLPNIARYEANIILKNTLFFPWYQTDYYSLPWTIFTQPNFARVGLTTQQAQKRYSDDLYMVTEHFSSLGGSPISSCTTGMCKLLIRANGEIVGCSLISDRAEDLITFIALMIQQKIKLNANPMRGLTSLSLATIYPSISEIWQQAFDNFYEQKLQRNSGLLNRLQSWFSYRKS